MNHPNPVKRLSKPTDAASRIRCFVIAILPANPKPVIYPYWYSGKQASSAGIETPSALYPPFN